MDNTVGDSTVDKSTVYTASMCKDSARVDYCILCVLPDKNDIYCLQVRTGSDTSEMGRYMPSI